jgi:orf24
MKQEIDKKGILESNDLANYIAYKYKEKMEMDISPLKLQKSLYFCFAYWGGFVRKGKNTPESAEIDLRDFSEYLYDEDIEAWIYGPVVPSVYRNFKIDKMDEEKAKEFEIKLKKKYNGILYIFISGLINDLIDANDFDLVDISHKDNAWKNNYNSEDKKHNKIINKEDIIDEYRIK